MNNDSYFDQPAPKLSNKQIRELTRKWSIIGCSVCGSGGTMYKQGDGYVCKAHRVPKSIEVSPPTPSHKPKNEILVHGGMKYGCESCGKQWFMNLEIGVEEEGKNGRPHQPSPFFIRCDCGEIAHDISGYLPLPELRSLRPGMRYFKYDNSGRRDACGKPTIYNP
jgi:hypothetical protein